jgi:hypothetical protein
MASILEELKAQTGGLWYLSYLQEKGLLTKEETLQTYVNNIFWCFNHISRGMTTADGNPKPYSQLAAIQVGTFLEEGALKKVSYTDPETKSEGWRFEIDFDKFPKSIDKLMKKVTELKALGNKAGAEMLVKYYVEGPGSKAISMDDIGKRYRSVAKESFYYSVRLD